MNVFERIELVERKLAAATDYSEIAEHTLSLVNLQMRLNPQRALQYALRLLHEAEARNDLPVVARSRYYVGLYHVYSYEYMESLPHLEQATQEFEQVGDQEGIFDTCRIIATVYSRLEDVAGEMQLTIDNFHRALLLRDEERLILAHMDMGDLHRNTENYPAGLEYYFKALQLIEPERWKNEAGLCYQRIGVIYGEIGDFQKSAEYFEKSLVLQKELQNMWGQAVVLQSLGSLHMTNSSYEQALHYLTCSYEVFQSLNAKPIRMLFLLGTLHIKMNNIPTALQYYRQALVLVKTNNDYGFEGRIYIEIASLYKNKGQWAAARRYYEKALDNSEFTKSLNYPIYEALADIAEAEGDFEKAHQYYKRATRLKEESLGVEKQRRIAALEVQNAIAEAEREKEIIRLKNEQLQREIELKARELASTALHLVERNKLLGQIEKQIIKILRTHRASRTTLLHDLLRTVREHKGSDEDWHIFEQQFEQLTRDFMFTLSQRFSHLTPTELRICALLRLSLTSKQISSLLFLDSRTVDSHRYNIRKKLDLNSKHNLTSFLTSL